MTLNHQHRGNGVTAETSWSVPTAEHGADGASRVVRSGGGKENGYEAHGPLRPFEQRRDDDGADVAIEVVGFGPTIQLAIHSVRKGGSIGCVGNLKAEVPFPLQAVVTRELSVFGSCASAGEYAEAVEAVANGSIQAWNA